MPVLLMLFSLAANVFTAQPAQWKVLAPGLELNWLTVKKQSPAGDSKIALVRIDPTAWQMEIVGRSRSGETAGLSARQWAEKYGLAVVINAGMFGTDHLTHVGYMEWGGHVHSRQVNSYLSVAAFAPCNPEHDPPFQIFDLDAPGTTIQTIREKYAALVQNLRLVKKPGKNCWSRQEKKWSEAALGEDKNGKILLIFSRSPFAMAHLNEELLAAGIGLVALQHLEGGPEAQLYLKAGGTELELFGSYETAFNENNGNPIAWPIPNILGVRARRSDEQK